MYPDVPPRNKIVSYHYHHLSYFVHIRFAKPQPQSNVNDFRQSTLSHCLKYHRLFLNYITMIWMCSSVSWRKVTLTLNKRASHWFYLTICILMYFYTKLIMVIHSCCMLCLISVTFCCVMLSWVYRNGMMSLEKVCWSYKTYRLPII